MSGKNIKLLISVMIIAAALLMLCARTEATRRADETTLEVEMADRLESMLEKIVGKERALVKVDIRLSRPSREISPTKLKSSLVDVPGIAFSKTDPEKEKARRISNVSTIETIAITVFLDNKTPPDKVEAVKDAVPKWMELDLDRGDTLRIELIPWKELPPEDIAVKQLSFMKGNLLAIVGIASIIILVFVLFALLALPARKMITQRLKMPSEAKKLRDMTDIMKDLKNVIIKSSAGAAKNLDGLLEDIKGILGRAPTRGDSLLEEIRDVLEGIAATQSKMPGKEGGAGSAPAAGQQEGSPAEAPGFLSALKETLSPLSEGAGGLSPEALQVLQSIEEHVRRQGEATAAGDTLDEPFKYLNTITTKEISLYIEGEEPRIAAIILGHIDPNKSAEVMSALRDERKMEISVAMATLVENDKVAQEIKDFIQRKMPEVKLRSDFSPITGSKALASVLSSSPFDVTSYVLDNLQKENPTLAEAVKKEMFLFEDIVNLEDTGIGEILKSVDRHRLSLALMKTSDAVKEKFFKNMTERAVEMIKEEMEALQPTAGGATPGDIVFFEDIVGLGQKRFQQIFSTIDRDTIKLALKGTSEEVRQKVFSVMTERGAAMLREDIEVMPNIARERTQEAQKEILDYIQKLEQEPIAAQQEIVNKIRDLERAGRISLNVKK
ncbi:FliG C-terminal domain-containing protein [Candidatus Omnitrophota bacterium]